MKRSVFLKFPLLATPILTGASSKENDRPKAGIKVEKDQDRFNEKIELSRVGSRVDTKVSTKDTEGDLYIYESRTVGKGGPPLHVHPNQDEWIYILQGEYEFQVGEERYRLKAGDSLLAPRQVKHAFSYEGEGLGKMVIVFQPAGKMEAFFHEASKRTTRPTLEETKDLFRRHDMEIVGPNWREAETKFKN
jgi:quercetin dioxygenase-like cupin family protein